jgi:hypothetical protein
LKDPETKGIILIGEIGGNAEEMAAAYLTEHNSVSDAFTILLTIAHETIFYRALKPNLLCRSLLV